MRVFFDFISIFIVIWYESLTYSKFTQKLKKKWKIKRIVLNIWQIDGETFKFNI